MSTEEKKKQFKEKHSIHSELERHGIVTNGRRSIKCPFHQDRNPSFSIDDSKGVWNCHAGCGGGDVFNLLAKFEQCTVEDVLKRYIPRDEAEATQAAKTAPQAKIDRIYSYQDANGIELYQALRMVPKTFRQRHQRNGEWVWNMEGVNRVLFNLPAVVRAERVWIVEGEKDAESLNALGYVATCNVGGAGKWLDGYNESLEGREIVLCGDNDGPGIDHMEKVFNSISNKVKNTRKIKIPGDIKDVSDYIATFGTPAEAKLALDGLVDVAPVMVKGVNVPIFSICEMEDAYRDHVANLSQNQLNLGKWLPTLGLNVRGLVPGELVTIIAATGVGKTAILQNIARFTAPLPTVLFEMELPPELVYERFMGVAAGWDYNKIEQEFKSAIAAGERFGEIPNLKHVFVCTEAGLTMEKLEQYILRAELKIGQKPRVVLLDYIQLMQGKGSSRYERMSNVAEQLKILAKSTRTIIFVASQAHRKEGEKGNEVTLFDAKDSGSIENSSGLVLGAWRDPDDKSRMYIKILKNTKGTGGVTIDCQLQGSSMQIKEISKTADVKL